MTDIFSAPKSHSYSQREVRLGSVNPFSFFAGGMQYLFEATMPFDEVILMLFMSMDLGGRSKFLRVLNTLLPPERDPDSVLARWYKAGGAVRFDNPQDCLLFLQKVRDICQSRQQLIVAHGGGLYGTK